MSECWFIVYHGGLFSLRHKIGRGLFSQDEADQEVEESRKVGLWPLYRVRARVKQEGGNA